MPGDGERIPRFAEAAALCRELGLAGQCRNQAGSRSRLHTAEMVARLTAEFWQGCRSAIDFLILDRSAGNCPDLAPGIPRGVLYEVPPRLAGGTKSSASRFFALRCGAFD
jgi:glycerophosphoryl diester phosphodiesterase